MDDLCERLEGLLAKATPGPWQTGSLRLPGQDLNHVVDMGPPPSSPFAITYRGSQYSAPRAVCHSDDGSSDANAALIVEAINALPTLLAERRRLREAGNTLLSLATHNHNCPLSDRPVRDQDRCECGLWAASAALQETARD